MNASSDVLRLRLLCHRLLQIVSALLLIVAPVACAKQDAIDVEDARELLARPALADLPALVDLREIGIRAEIGAREGSEPLGTLHRPVDAVIHNDKLFVLEQLAPWVRVFRLDGQFLHTMIDFAADTASDIAFPLSLRATADGGVVINDGGGVLRSYDSTGHMSARTQVTGMRFRGGLEACDGKIFSFAFLAGSHRVGVFGRMIPGTSELDTILRLDTLRENSPIYYPASIVGTRKSVVFFSDEVANPRIVEVLCDGTFRRRFEVKGLGADERVVPNKKISESAAYFKAPTEPLPSGLGMLGNHVLWAVRIKTRPSSTPSADSMITVITDIDEHGEARRIGLKGWFHLLGADGDSTLILGKGFGMTRRLRVQPSVFVVDGRLLLHMIDSVGT